MRTEVRRPLSPVERWNWIADQISPLNVVARVHLRGYIAAGVLERAAAALVAEHPLLRVTITSDAGGANPTFVPSSQVIPVRMVHGDDCEWERQVDAYELGTSLDWRSGPLVRIVDVVLDSAEEEHDLVLTVSHIIADATTALSLLHRLIEHADRRAAPACVDDLVASRPVVGAPEDLLPARHRGPRGIARLAATGLADGLATALARPCRLTPESIVNPAQRRTRLVRRTLTSTQVDDLMRRCRHEGVTVHGALAAAMAMVIGPTAAQRDSGRICIGSAINFRSELNPPVSADEAGSYVTTVPSIVRFGSDRDLWSIARQINRSLGRRRRFGQHLASLFAMRLVCPASAAESSKVFGLMERNGPLNVCISNIGRYDFAARIGDWQLCGAQFIASLPPIGYFLATVNTSHDELSWNFTYTDGVVSRRSVQRFADGCLQTLLAAAESRAALCANAIADPAHDQSHAIRPGVDSVMRTEVLRPLSPVERWFWIADQISPLNVIAHVRLTGHVPDGLLERAAANLAAEYPLLRVAIRAKADGTNPVFAPSSQTISVRTVHGDECEWDRQVDEHELGTSLDWHSGPLVRIVDVVSDAPQEAHDLVLTVSHIIADGTTALSLLRRLVEYAAANGDAVGSRPVVGAPEDLLPARYRGPRGIARLAATGLADGLATALARPCRLTPESIVNPAQRRTRLVRRMLTSTQVDDLMRRCRQEGVTVHGALAAAMAMVIGPTAAQRDSGRICIGSAIEFRAQLDPPVSADEAGVYVAAVPSIVRFGGDCDLWSIARQVNRSLGGRRRFGQHLASLFAMRLLCPASVTKSSKAFGLIERNGPLNLGIWNIGRYDFAARIGDWQLSGAQFISGVSISGYLVATVNTSHDELFWNFSYIDVAVSRRSAQRFADGCLQTLLRAIA
jgi:NRPS condensation-like uncharacterized protein